MSDQAEPVLDVTVQFFAMLDDMIAGTCDMGCQPSRRKRATARKAVRQLAWWCGVRTDDGMFREAAAERFGK